MADNLLFQKHIRQHSAAESPVAQRRTAAPITEKVQFIFFLLIIES